MFLVVCVPMHNLSSSWKLTIFTSAITQAYCDSITITFSDEKHCGNDVNAANRVHINVTSLSAFLLSQMIYMYYKRLCWYVYVFLSPKYQISCSTSILFHGWQNSLPLDKQKCCHHSFCFSPLPGQNLTIFSYTNW